MDRCLLGFASIVWFCFVFLLFAAGDCVLMRPSDSNKPPYVALVERIEADHRNIVKVRVPWYYRPEESIDGRRQFHGTKEELFMSDHLDVQSAHTIEGKCVVHSFKNYTKLENVGSEDYFCRFEYKVVTGGFTPDRLAVYCKCEMLYNPDDLMVQCEGCNDWFHPSCMGMTIEEAQKLDQFLCSDCLSGDDVKRSMDASPVSPYIEAKVAEEALFLWNNDHVSNLITQNHTVMLPIIFSALERSTRGHWNQAVQSLTLNVWKIFSDAGQELFDKCFVRFQENEVREREIHEKRESTWKCLEEVAESKVVRNDLVLASRFAYSVAIATPDEPTSCCRELKTWQMSNRRSLPLFLGEG